MSFLGEIKRRKIFQVAAVYAVVAWLLIQIVATVEAPLRLPDWFDTMVILLLAIGFPVTLIISWAFNLTPEGIVREADGEAPASGRGRTVEHVLFGVLALAVVFLFIDNYVLNEPDETVAVTATSSAIEGAVENVDTQPAQDVLPNSIAVLPFTNLSPDPDNAYFAAGIYQSTLNQLGQVSELFVIASASVMQYANDPPPIPEIANALNVEVVMVGSVRYADGRVLIAPQLIDGRTGRQIWSKEYKRELTDVFAVQGEVAEQIAIAMQVQLMPEERARIESTPTKSEKAYQHYLYALSLPNWTSAPENWDAYRQSLDLAILADPEFAEAYATLSYDLATRGDTDLAVEYARKAIDLNPTVPRAYRTLGDIDADYYVRQERAREALKRSVELGPNDAGNLSYYAYRLADDGRDFTEAIRLVRRAVAIDPKSGSALFRLGFILMRSGDLAGAVKYMNQAVLLSPDYVSLTNLATAQYLDGDHISALENLERATEIMSSKAVFRVDYVAYLYGLLGRAEKSKELVTRFDEMFGERERQAGRTLGWGILGTRDKERAVKEWTNTVNAYIDDGQPVSPGRISRFRDNWLNDPMLEEPEFLELRRRLGFRG
jgi:TolB-like protein/Flp pilus assembly protein TadD